MSIAKWEFEGLPQERTNLLRSAPPFPEIIERINKEMKILCYHRDVLQSGEEQKQFSRAAFCISVSEDLFDIFFNSSEGYRGQYFLSPAKGLSSNAAVIRLLLPRLLDYTKDSAGLDLQFVEGSFTAPSAKVWLAEIGKGLCDACDGQWHSGCRGIQIRNDRWENSDHREWACKAVRFTKLRIFGAFVNERHEEFVPRNKCHRATDINQTGWS